jgi:hypothetical protein
MKVVKYPKTEQFRNVIAAINRMVTYVGPDVNGDPIYDMSIPKPKLTFKGTVKLHGSNAGVSCNAKDGIYTQSRNNAFDMTEQPDSHMGFTHFVRKSTPVFSRFFEDIFEHNKISADEFTATIYGEWAGKGIQRGVGISEIPKSFFIFGVKISKPGDDEFDSYWVDYNYSCADEGIYNIDDFGTYEVEVDFNMPQLAQTKFSEITLAVEEECPVAKHFGHSGVGEGVVWSTLYKGSVHRFKVKGEKHSVSKVKTLAPVDVEKLNSIKEFVDYAVTENRFDQAITEVFGSYDKMDVKKMGDFIRWVVKDIMSEELDTMTENGLEPKDVNKFVSSRAREMFFTVTNKQVGL